MIMLELRSDFPYFDHHPNETYLDTAATAHKPRPVIEAIANGYARDYASVHRGLYARSVAMTDAFEAVREKVACFINAPDASEIVFTKGATESINLVAQSYASQILTSESRVVLTVMEHHANILPWQLLQKKLGFEIVYLDIDPKTGQVASDDIVRAVTPNCRLIAVTHLSNVLGSRPDIALLKKQADQVGAKILLDGCQAVAHERVDVQELGADFYVFSGHKLYGPTGIGILWGRRALLEAMPPWQGGGAMIEHVTVDGSTYAPAPARFEAGTPPIVQALGLEAAINYLQEIGMEAVTAHEAALNDAMFQSLSQIGNITVHSPDHASGIFSFNMQKAHPHDIATIFDECDVAIRAGHHCAQPLMQFLGIGATARASLGLYSTLDDIERMVQALNKAIRIFRS